MQVTRESDSTTEVTLSISMDSEDEEPFLNRSYRRLAARVRIPGFRPGKAPRSVVESHLGRATLLQEALEFMIPESLDQVLRENEIRAFAEPRLEVLDLEPVSFKAVVPLEPEVDLGEFRSIRVSAPPVEVSEDDVNKVLEDLRFQSSPWEPAERPVAFGDLVTMNVQGTVAGQQIIDDEAVDFVPELDNNMPVPGFSVYLEGMVEGQTKDFTLPVPDEGYQEDLAGKECRFNVEVLSVKEKQLPDFDDEFAKGVRDGYESMEALTEYVREQLTGNAEATAQMELERNVLDEVKKVATIQASEIIYEREVESIREDQERRLSSNRINLETYLRFTGQTAEEWEGQFRPQAEDRLETYLILRKLAETESLEIADDEIDAEIDRLMENSSEETADSLRRMLNSDDSRDSLRTSLLNRKVMARLVEIAKGEGAEGDAEADVAEDTTGDDAAEATVAQDESGQDDSGQDKSGREAADAPASEEESYSGDAPAVGERSNE